MLRSMVTVCLGGTLREKLEAIAAARFDAVEIFAPDLEAHAGGPRAARVMAQDLGLQIVALQPLREIEGVPGEQLVRNLDRAERMFEVASELGAPLVGVCSNVAPTTIPDDGLAAAQLHALAERAARYNLKVGYEGLAWGAHVNDYAHAQRVVELAAHPQLGLVLDSFHTLVIGDDPDSIAAIPPERIFLIQIADAPRLHMGFLSWSRHYRCFPGHGDLDVARFVRAVIRSGYTGALSLEIFNDRYQKASPAKVALEGIRSLRQVTKQARAREEEHALARPHA